MDFLKDYWTYNQCYEVHRNYAIHCALSLIGATMHRKVYFLIGDVEVFSHDYTILVGPMGNKKNTPCDFARGVFKEVNPTLLLGASNQTAEDIVKILAEEKSARAFFNENKESVEVRQMAFFITEFKNFIAYNPIRMINFLTEIFDRKVYDSGTIKRGSEMIINPSINILACENPDQFVKFMKNDVITGGVARRFITVYEPSYKEPIPRPIITPEAAAAWQRVEDRLKAAKEIVGCFKETPEGGRFYDDWYIKNHKRMAKEANPVVKGYLSTKGEHLRKIAMKIDVVSDKPMLLFTPDIQEEAMFYLDGIEEHMPKLTMAAGRNELLLPQMKALEVLRVAGGWMPKKRFLKETESDMTPQEQFNMVRHLESSGQAVIKMMQTRNFEGNLIEREVVMLTDFYEKQKINGNVLVKSPQQPTASESSGSKT